MFIGFPLLYTNCQWIDPKEKIPSYIQIDSLTYQGITPHGFSCAYVYVNYKLIGVFEIPATIPVLEEGECRITVRPGIDVNAYSYEREYYRLTGIFETRKTLVAAETQTINPTFTTIDDAELVWNEDFDNSAITLIASDSLTPQIQIERESRPGNSGYVGKIRITPTDTLKDFFDYSMYDSVEVYFQSTPGFYEVSFKSNIAFEMRFKAFNQTTGMRADRTLMWVYPSPDTWKRIYINFSTIVSDNDAGTYYKPYFRVRRMEEFRNIDTLKVNLDDIRIIYLKRN